jgi:hypothetical protein
LSEEQVKQMEARAAAAGSDKAINSATQGVHTERWFMRTW